MQELTHFEINQISGGQTNLDVIMSFGKTGGIIGGVIGGTLGIAVTASTLTFAPLLIGPAVGIVAGFGLGLSAGESYVQDKFYQKMLHQEF